MDNTVEDRAEIDRRRKAYTVAAEVGLTRDERMALANYVLRRDVTSWKQLSDSQMTKLIDSIEGFVFIHALMMQRA